MGADGHIVVVKREEWDRAHPDVKPSDIGLYTGTVLGVEACWGYFGDNLCEPNYLTPWSSHSYAESIFEDGELRDATPEESERIRKAAVWFNANAETHEVWT